jgi:5-methylcytosine-specific restriction protein A
MTRARNRVCSEPGCPNIQPAPRCRVHRSARDAHQRRTTPTKVTRDWHERQRRKGAVDAHRQVHGNWCPGYRIAPHRAEDLTADHITPIDLGGDPRGPLAVLCRSCNSRKAARR